MKEQIQILTQAEIQQLADDGISYPWTPWQLLSLKRERDDALARAVNAEDEAQRMHDDACELQQQIDDLEAEVERLRHDLAARVEAAEARVDNVKQHVDDAIETLRWDRDRLKAEVTRGAQRKVSK